MYIPMAYNQRCDCTPQLIYGDIIPPKARAYVSVVFLWFSRFSLLAVFLAFSSHDQTFQAR